MKELVIYDLKDKNSTESEIAVVFGGEYLRDEFKTMEYEFKENKIILFDNFRSPIAKKAKITIPFAISGVENNDKAMRFDTYFLDLIKWKNPGQNVKSIQEIFESLDF